MFASGGLVPAIGVLLGPPVAVICGVASASMIMLGAKKARMAKRKAEDPPDVENYRRPVMVRRGRLYEDAFGDSALERATLQAGDSILAAIGYESAMVRADERAAGAAEMGDRSSVAARLEEALRYARSAAAENWRVQTGCHRVADEFERLDIPREELQRTRPPARLDLALPDQALVTLYRAGFRIEQLRVPISRYRPLPEDPLALITSRLRIAAEASGTFGGILEEVAEQVYSRNDVG